MNARRIPLIIGLVLAVGTGVLLLVYVNALRPSVASVPTVQVLVAAHDLPAHAVITSDAFTVERRTATAVDSDAVADPKNVAGRYTLVSIPAGSVLTASRVGRSTADTLQAELAPGMRAVSISIDDVKGVAGLITPGDRVDVIAIPPRSGDETPRGYAILRGVLVLAMGTEVRTAIATQSPLAGRPALTTVTLAMTPDQVDLLAGADVDAVLRLALRNPTESIRAFPAEPLRLPPLSAAPPGPGSPVAPTSQRPPGTAPAAPRITVIDGDRVLGGGAISR